LTALQVIPGHYTQYQMSSLPPYSFTLSFSLVNVYTIVHARIPSQYNNLSTEVLDRFTISTNNRTHRTACPNNENPFPKQW